MEQASGATVLIVEDDRHLGEVYVEWLSTEYSPLLATSKEDALALFAVETEVDVVLLDRRLPRSSGTEVLEAIRDRDERCQVAMVTAVEPDFDIIEMGFDGYLTKPVSADELRNLVDRMVTRLEYSRRLQRLETLLEKRLLLESNKSQDVLDGSDEYQSLVDEIESLKLTLESTSSELSSAEISSPGFWRTILNPSSA